MIQEIMEKALFGNQIADYLRFVFIFLAGFIVIKILQYFILKRLRKWSKETATKIDEFVLRFTQHIILPLAYLSILYFCTDTLVLPPLLKRTIDIAGMAILAIFTVRLAMGFISYGFRVYLSKRGKDSTLERSLSGIMKMIRIVLWALAAIFFLDNLGFKVSAVMAGLGIGGIAIALAAQAILGDLLSYFAILLDHPFGIGDSIVVGEFTGSIEHIGIKTTRIRSVSGEQLIFSNTDLTNSRIRNYERMEQRRIVFKLNVKYGTSLDELKTIPGLVENIIKNIKDTIFDRAHFFSYGDSGLVFEIVYFIIGSDYNKYMDI
ncbi:MAG: mechanosensitive ion channel protein MscS [Candidatus Omnitrophica bacterium CG07_land_8_20_14_0_80_42_15]|uniref:Mechanosensitive ion channel protein MscS n=1 Tax=Candidatus Aquitaenariimonas noxiae TaxID=1974741 RepID=A0A2J0KYN1_9BACT|nr:MAG: mechanosensitive ion channel protein MscS [Candidatus Omnitrophica bacterium CG07_land_8_20_14_0_80_42_15]